MNLQKFNTVELMTSAPVGSLIIKNAIPTIITMMVTAIYNTADTFFVSRLGTSASGAVGVIFSLMTIIQACGFMIGMGAGSITSRALGSGNSSKAQTVVSTAIVCVFSLGVFLAVLGTVFNHSLVRCLGATETILPFAVDYARFIILGTPFMMSAFAMNNLLRFQGKAAFSMIGMVIGGVLNMVLDPIFIFVFDMGISGAAVATVISQITSFSILLSMFFFNPLVVKFSPRAISRKFSVYWDIVTTGLPSLFRQGTTSVSTIFMNLGAAKFGAMMGGFNMSGAQTADAAVAGMSISNRICMLLMAVAIGFGQGFQPVCGINLGAKKYHRVKQAVAFLIKCTAIVMAVLGAFVFIFAPQIAASFREDPAVIKVASSALRLSCLVLPFHSVIFGTNMLLQTAGEKLSAIILSSLRQGIVFIPVILALPRLILVFGGEPIIGIMATPALSDLISALITLPFLIFYLKRITSQINSGKTGKTGKSGKGH